jgi:hypothetical protein
LLVGAVLAVVGLALAATAPVLGSGAGASAHVQQTAGGLIVVAGWAALAWGIHRFGREERLG